MKKYIFNCPTCGKVEMKEPYFCSKEGEDGFLVPVDFCKTKEEYIKLYEEVTGDILDVDIHITKKIVEICHTDIEDENWEKHSQKIECWSDIH